MSFKAFDKSKMEEYTTQAKAKWGKTDAYKEFQKKSGSRTPAREKELGSQVMDFFARLGSMRPCAPDCEAAQAWAKDLQAFFTEHFGEVIVVNEVGACGVDEDRGGTDEVELTRTEDLRFVLQTCMDGDDVSRGEHGIGVGEGDVEAREIGIVGRDVGVGGDELDALDDILSKKVIRKLETQNPIYLRNSAEGLISYLDELFGQENMKLCKDYIHRLERNA